MSPWELHRIEQRAYLLDRKIRIQSDRLGRISQALTVLGNQLGDSGGAVAGGWVRFYAGCGGEPVEGLGVVFSDTHGGPTLYVTTGPNGRLFVPCNSTNTYQGSVVSVPAGYRRYLFNAAACLGSALGSVARYAETHTYYLIGGEGWACYPDFPTNANFTINYDYSRAQGGISWVTQSAIAGSYDGTTGAQTAYPDSLIPTWPIGIGYNSGSATYFNTVNLFVSNNTNRYTLTARLGSHAGAYSLYLYGSAPGSPAIDTVRAGNWFARWDLAPTTCAPTLISLADTPTEAAIYKPNGTGAPVPVAFDDPAGPTLMQYTSSGTTVTAQMAGLPFPLAVRSLSLTTP